MPAETGHEAGRVWAAAESPGAPASSLLHASVSPSPGGDLLPHEATGMVTSRLQMVTRKKKFISIS